MHCCAAHLCEKQRVDVVIRNLPLDNCRCAGYCAELLVKLRMTLAAPLVGSINSINPYASVLGADMAW